MKWKTFHLSQISGITVCVEYDDILSLTLPKNACHFERIVVVSSPADKRTAVVVEKVPNAELYVTDAFYQNGAHFNKGLAIEEGLDFLGRHGWMAIIDADIVMPKTMLLDLDAGGVQIGNLYTPFRRMCYDPAGWDGTYQWDKYKALYEEREFAGYFQLFHADDPVLADRPWYGVDWKTAAGCDSDFQSKWSDSRKIRPGFEVLHLGQNTDNWCGRRTARLDGEAVPEAAERKQSQENYFALRNKHGDFHGEKIGGNGQALT